VTNEIPESPQRGGEFVLAGHDLHLDYHRMLLDDVNRMDAYERAIRALVKPGDVVLDLGAGSGILSMLAAKRGARVHAVESTQIAGLARQLVEANGLSDRVTVHHADLREMAVIEPVDLIVSDFMGRFLVDDGMMSAMRAAVRWLRPGGRVCPAKVTLYLAPIGPIHFRAHDVFEEPFYGLDLSVATRYALNTNYHAQVGPQLLLAPAQLYYVLDPIADVLVNLHFDEGNLSYPAPCATLNFDFEHPDVVRGVVGWFNADLADGVELSTAPGVETHWGQYLFPLPTTQVERGDRLEFKLAFVTDPQSGDPNWTWRGAFRRGEEIVRRFSLESDQRLGQREVQP